MRLTPKQEKFCLAYVATGNASEAYRQSYNCKNMKPATIKRSAHELMQNPNIAATIDRLNKEEQDRLKHKYQVDNDRVITELFRVAFADIGKLFSEDGLLLHPHQIDTDTRLALANIEVVARKQSDGSIEYVHKFKMLDKLGALEKLAKMLGMYEKQNAQKSGVKELRDILNRVDSKTTRLPDVRSIPGKHE